MSSVEQKIHNSFKLLESKYLMKNPDNKQQERETTGHSRWKSIKRMAEAARAGISAGDFDEDVIAVEPYPRPETSKLCQYCGMEPFAAKGEVEQEKLRSTENWSFGNELETMVPADAKFKRAEPNTFKRLRIEMAAHGFEQDAIDLVLGHMDDHHNIVMDMYNAHHDEIEELQYQAHVNNRINQTCIFTVGVIAVVSLFI